MKNQTLINARIYTTFSGCALFLFAFIKGAQLTMDNPMKQNYILVMFFAELLIIFSLLSIFYKSSK